LLSVLLALALAGCGRASDPVWDEIESSGQIVIGTSADYPPFEYYNEYFQITGFDAAIAQELGERLGLRVELVDIAFDGLISAVEIGQVDAAIAALSVTPERQARVDFSDVYYAGRGSALALEGSAIDPIVVRAQLAAYRVGVQRGSVYDSWILTNLVTPGLMPPTNLLVYEEPVHAVSDLRQGRNDVVVMDAGAADEYLQEGGVKVVGQGLNPQLFAVALPKGASTLQARINDALTEMRNDGTLVGFAVVYLGTDRLEEPPAVAPTPAPGPTATPPACTDVMEFIDDVTVPDGTEMQPGQDFDKVWRIHNVGTCTWDSSYRVAFVDGYSMGGDEEHVQGTVPYGASYDMTIDQEAPDDPGTYVGVWEMRNGNNVAFGERLRVEIVVPGEPEPTAVPPTATPVPPVAPTPAPAPVIEYLTAEPASVTLGGTVTVSWSFSGQDLASARLYAAYEDGTVLPLYGGADVPPTGSVQDVPAQAGLVSYVLQVTSEFGGYNARAAVVEVLAPEVQPLQ
jgi:polar amino acid transport system substrate-binding protein